MLWPPSAGSASRGPFGGLPPFTHERNGSPVSTEIFQAAYVVDDIDAAIDGWGKVANIGPFFVMRDAHPDTFVYRGERADDFRSNLAFVQSGPIQIELIEPVSSGPNLYRDFAPAGADAYHHQAYWHADLEAETARFTELGVERIAYGTAGSMHFSYFDTTNLIGCITEVLQHDEGMAAFMQSFADAATDWDGTDPVRVLGGGFD
jgi:hypothetical protein